jgi:hypothetical protein
MAYSSVTKPEDYFNTKLYSGTGSSQAITGVGFQPDWVWIKSRSDALSHALFDSIRGTTKVLNSNANTAEYTNTDTLTAFGTDGFTVGSNTGVNASGETRVSWNWIAGGTAPAITYVVKVVSDSGNKYRFDDFGTSAVTLELQEGGTYTFDQSDSSNSGHPLRFYTASDKTGGEYTTGVTTTGTPGSSGAQTVITVAASAPTLYYQCSNHAGMGGQANTNSLFGSSNFSGSTQSTVSANTTAGFSIVSYTGTGANATVGHGLGSVPQWIITKDRDNSNQWYVYHVGIGNTHGLRLSTTDAKDDDATLWNDTTPTSSVFSVGSNTGTNRSANPIIAYCFADKTGYSKFSSYTGNGNADGAFIYTGFKPALTIIKNSGSTGPWYLFDNKRPGFNVINVEITANSSDSEATDVSLDFLSNGFKLRKTGTGVNGDGNSYIYMAFAENPFVANDSGTVVPSTAK